MITVAFLASEKFGSFVSLPLGVADVKLLCDDAASLASIVLFIIIIIIINHTHNSNDIKLWTISAFSKKVLEYLITATDEGMRSRLGVKKLLHICR